MSSGTSRWAVFRAGTKTILGEVSAPAWRDAFIAAGQAFAGPVCVELAADRAVDHPAHYGGADDPYEVIKVLRAWLTPEQYKGFCLGNTIKYQARHEKKGGLEDLKKARWYQDELIRFKEERCAIAS